MKVAIQGEPGSFHDLAAKKFFGNEYSMSVPCRTFDSTLDKVIRGEADKAIIAVENSRSGAILYNYSLIRETGLRVKAEYSMRIRQNLMALPGQSIDMLTEVRSHPVAISQCMDFLNRYPSLALISCEDTAASAREISQRALPGRAAIASEMAASIYGLEILAEGIETRKPNYTRFFILDKEIDSPDEADKASVCFSLDHRPGALACLLNKLAEERINLTRIQSVPLEANKWEYLFYLDLEFETGCKAEKIIDIVGQNTGNMKVLGIYNKG